LEAGRKLGFAVEPIDIEHPADLADVLSEELLAGLGEVGFTPDAALSAHMSEII
jgi:putative tryptophan/tyrosine transport system substrate-binding protein